MPTRNINLTEHYARFLARTVESGRYKNTSEVVRAALRLLERQEREDEAKLEALRDAFSEGRAAVERGAFSVMAGEADIDRFFDDFDREVDRS